MVIILIGSLHASSRAPSSLRHTSKVTLVKGLVVGFIFEKHPESDSIKQSNRTN